MEMHIQIINIPDLNRSEKADIESIFVKFGISVDVAKPMVLDCERIPSHIMADLIAYISAAYGAQEIMRKKF